MKWLALIVFISVIGCDLNGRKTKQNFDVKNVNANEQYAQLILKDTIQINGVNPIIGQISTVISKIGLDGHIVLYDKKSRLFLEYDETGRFIGIIGEKGSGPGEYIKPSNILIDERGYKYIFDTNKFTTIVFDSKNNFVREYKYRLGFPFPGELFLGQEYKIITLSHFDKSNRYKNVGYFHFLDNAFKIEKSIKIDYPEIYGRYDLFNLTMPVWDTNESYFFVTFPAENKIYTYDMSGKLLQIWRLNSKYFKEIDQKLDETVNPEKKIRFFLSYSLSDFLKIFKKNYIFYGYSKALEIQKSTDSRKEGYFNIITTKGQRLNTTSIKLPGRIIDLTDEGLLYTLINENPNTPVIGVYKIEIHKN